MSNIKKLMMTAAGGEPLNVENVFSTYVYEGTGSTQTITNGIDIDGEGGLVWIKSRSWSYPHNLYDTERGATKRLKSSGIDAESTLSTGLTAFSSTGFTLGGDNDTNGTYSDAKYTSWTFRKARKFFDVVTYTGDGTNNRSIAHSLGCQFGMLIVKCTSHNAQWIVWHRSNGNGKYLILNEQTAVDNDLYNFFGSDNTTNGSTHFSVSSNNRANESGRTYVAYLFAHNDGDGDFGPTGDQDIIKCGSYTGNGSSQDIDLGFEPQWIMIKNASSTQNWWIVDNMRGIVSGGNDPALLANDNGAEITGNGVADLNPNGFKVYEALYNTSSNTYIYMAIRRGPMAVPESATDVFAITTANSTTNPLFTSGFVTDMALRRPTTVSDWYVASRLTSGRFLRANNTDTESYNTSVTDFGYQNGYYTGGSTSSTNYSWMWKRAPNYFDVVAYTGNGTAGHTIDHNLGVKPDMMWVRQRDGTNNWCVIFPNITLPNSITTLYLNASSTGTTSVNVVTGASSTDFTLGFGGLVNNNSSQYIAYLFASLDGVSKVGSYTGNGSTQTIDCGFSSGARFVLCRKVSAGDNWNVFDSVRGITTGSTDPLLLLNTTDAQYNETQYNGGNIIQPHNSGFQLTNDDVFNTSGASYVFYAIA